MPGAEVEDLAQAALVGDAGAEDLAAFKPGNEHDFLRLGDDEGLAVHLLMRQAELLGQALDDGVGGVDHPEDFLLVGLAPAQRVRVRAAQLAENLAGVAGVQHHQAHARHHAAIDAVHHLVRHLMVGHVAPPQEDIGVVQHFLGQAVLLLPQGSRPGRDALLGVEETGDAAMDALGVDCADGLVAGFVKKLVPDSDADGRHSASPSLWVFIV